jgi:membrane-associated PAP2 superfamily phosphatase
MPIHPIRRPGPPLVLWTLGTLLLLLAWDALALDLPMAHWFGDGAGFPLRGNWLLSTVLHDGARRLAWVLAGALALTIWMPVGALRALTRGERTGLLLGTLTALLAISAVKSGSQTSCPWDLADFGGVAQHVSHWQWHVPDGGGGRCFPGGHASTGFSFVAGYFWLRTKAPRVALGWLALAMGAGLALGLIQQARGAHFMSHTLWTAWLCWTTAGLAHALHQHGRAWRAARPARLAVPPAGA